MMAQIGCLLSGLMFLVSSVVAQEEDRVQKLERQMELLTQELRDLKEDQELQQKTQDPSSKLRLGGYVDMHANFVEGGNDAFDIHRLVLYTGYDLSDWIKMHSEVELEHAYVTDGAGGEVSVPAAGAEGQVTAGAERSSASFAAGWCNHHGHQLWQWQWA